MSGSPRFGLVLVLWALTIHCPWALDVVDTRHLLDRTGFGARPADIQVFASLSRDEAIRRVLAEPTIVPAPPTWAGQRPLPDRRWLSTLPAAERRAKEQELNRLRQQQGTELKVWWYEAMLAADTPLTERMTLFWHNHFTSALQKVASPQLMWRQNALLRRQALDSFSDLLRAVATDPAMLIYLDGRINHRRQANENFARELLELFALGEGHYTEPDVRAASRALTGWTLDPNTGAARFQVRRYDDGTKAFLGHSGHWGTDAVIAIVLAQPRTAEFVVEKLWREFVSPRPDPAEVQRLASNFRDGGYAIRPLLRELLSSQAFWAKENRGSLIKSPVELIVGTLYRFQLPLPAAPMLVATGRQQGQDLFAPPTVKGWPGGVSWIDTNRLLARERFLRGVARDLADEGSEAGGPWDALDTATLTQLLLAVDGPAEPAAGGPEMNRRLIAAILDPRYQLK